MRKLKNILVWLGILIYLIVALSFVTNKKEQILCNTLNINICDSLKNSFVKKSDVLAIIEDKSFQLLGNPLLSINTENLELALQQNPFIKNVEIYKTINGVIKIDINQRSPIIRVIDSQNNNYYIDMEGFIMPLSDKYTSHVLIANGMISDISYIDANTRIECSNNNNSICDLFLLANYIYSNDFWRSQIQQIYINNNNEFELIPRVGAHIIFFGNINDYKEKFKKLEILYTKGLSKIGWNKYITINLKYKNQIICKKR